jgi:hypothetical protein
MHRTPLFYPEVVLRAGTLQSRSKRVRYVDPSLGLRKEAQDTRVAATTKKQRLEERNKRALFANVDDLKKQSKQEYCEFRR